VGDHQSSDKAVKLPVDTKKEAPLKRVSRRIGTGQANIANVSAGSGAYGGVMAAMTTLFGR
jgi:hypothetical protein